MAAARSKVGILLRPRLQRRAIEEAESPIAQFLFVTERPAEILAAGLKRLGRVGAAAGGGFVRRYCVGRSGVRSAAGRRVRPSSVMPEGGGTLVAGRAAFSLGELT